MGALCPGTDFYLNFEGKTEKKEETSMKKMSRRMKRMIALLVVEVLIAINVLTAYADEAGQPMTFTDAEVVEMTKSEPVVEQQPVQRYEGPDHRGYR